MNEFIFQNNPNIHISRRKEILKRYPEIKKLHGHYYPSNLYILLIVSFQLVVAALISTQAWWIVLIASYGIGAFANHALYVLIHECTHDLVMRSQLGNKIMGIVCDIPLFLPSAMGFRKYHMIHHKHLGEYSYDPDITSYTEARLVSNISWRKAVWLFFFSISQALRPLKVHYYRPLNFWTVLNTVLQIIFNIVIYIYLGPGALLYLGLSTLFALGLHPVGGRWIQEHYVTKEDQETYSYYGPLNHLCFNMGYHNEHHDFMFVPWISLPTIKKMAPEYYVNLVSYNSWTKVVLNFIFNQEMSSFNRIIHPDHHPDKNEAIREEVN